MFQVIADDNSEVTLSDENDTAYIQGNNSTVRGALGNDHLAVLLSGLGQDPVATTLWGGEGNDTLHAALTAGAEPDGNAITAELNGGAGDDEIEIRAASSLGGNQSLTATGGAGSDVISIDSNYINDEGYFHGVQVNVSGGDDADVIKVTVFAASSGGNIIDAGSGDDYVEADGLANEVLGWDGDDTIIVTASATAEYSERTYNYVEGGSGNDVIRMDDGGWGAENMGYGGDGDDSLTLEANGYDARNLAYGDAGDDTLILRADGTYYGERASASNEAHGGEGNDAITAAIALESVTYDDGTIDRPQFGLNLLYGDGGDDNIEGSISVDDPSGLEYAHSELFGGSGNDRLKASGGYDNVLWGNQGNDSLYGSGNADRLIGGVGADFLRGNGGADTLEFWGARGLSAGERDRIEDFEIGTDLIDVSRIDANVFRSGNQAFRFNDSPDDWQGTGRLWVEDNPDNEGSIVYASTGQKMLAINLLDGTGVDASDYSASDFLL